MDDYGQERQTSAWKSYLDAKEAVTTVEKNKSEADIAMWQAQQAIIDAEDAIEYKNNNSINPATNEEYTEAEKAIIDKTLEKAKLAFTEAETKYKNADSEISAARAQVTAAWRDYQKNAATIVAPEAGVVSNLNLAAGMVVITSYSIHYTKLYECLWRESNPHYKFRKLMFYPLNYRGGFNSLPELIVPFKVLFKECLWLINFR